MRHTPRLIRSVKQFSIALLTVALAGCLNIADPPKGLTILAITAGNNQNIAVNATASDPLVVRAFDETATPMAGVVITFTITNGGGSLTATSATTNSSGDASVNYKPAAPLGTVNIKASSKDLNVTFTETVIAAT